MDTISVPEGAVLALPDASPTRVQLLDAGAGWVAAVAAPPGTTFRIAWLRPPRAQPGCDRAAGVAEVCRST
jgi:hypothetical protein